MHVGEHHLGQLGFAESFVKGYMPILALLRLKIGLQRGRCRTENNLGVVQLTEHERDIAGVVSRSWLLLLVGGVVFLVDDD